MTIKVIYSGKDFWGQRTFNEETNDYATADDLKKAFRAMSRDREFAIHVNSNFSITWGSYSDFENRVVLIRRYESWNSYDEIKMSWEKMKKYITQEVSK